MDTPLLSYYEAIEQASADMLSAAQRGDWDQVMRLEGACGVLISALNQAARSKALAPQQARDKARILQRILLNDARIRSLAGPLPAGFDEPRTLH
ncbi:flagellar protein FliT [Azohydromonas aeria]|uniref:flagellar protein FliT n=1 Tax=Azohydromonas aeria TaxID=2590212 RepID=UPI0012F74732|nr:flagellar protein FliT [Azohydromonas aeria]